MSDCDDDVRKNTTWGQWYNGYSVEDIDEATKNVIIIKNKILILHGKLEKLNEFKTSNENEKASLKEQMKRLEMSKNCIKYYYGLEINL